MKKNNSLRYQEYKTTRTVHEHLKEIDKKLKKNLGEDNFKKMYLEHCQFLLSEESEYRMSNMEKIYFNMFIADISSNNGYNLKRSKIDTTQKVILAIMKHLQKVK